MRDLVAARPDIGIRHDLEPSIAESAVERHAHGTWQLRQKALGREKQAGV